MSGPGSDRLHDLLDGRLSADEAEALRVEIASSPALAAEMAELERLRALFEAVPPATPPVDLKASVMAALPGSPAATAPAPAPRGRLIVGWITAATAAAVLLGVMVVRPYFAERPSVATAALEETKDVSAERGSWRSADADAAPAEAEAAPSEESEQANRPDEGAPAGESAPVTRKPAAPAGAVAGDSRAPGAPAAAKKVEADPRQKRGAPKETAPGEPAARERVAKGDKSAEEKNSDDKSTAPPRKPSAPATRPSAGALADADDEVPEDPALRDERDALDTLDQLLDASRLGRLAEGREAAVVVIRVDDQRAAQSLMARLQAAEAKSTEGAAKQPAAPGAPSKRTRSTARRDAGEDDPADTAGSDGYSGGVGGLAAQTLVQSRDVRLNSAVRALLLSQRDILVVGEPDVGRVVAELATRFGEARSAPDAGAVAEADAPETAQDAAGKRGLEAEKQDGGGGGGGGAGARKGADPPAPEPVVGGGRKARSGAEFDDAERRKDEADADESGDDNAAPRPVRVVIVVAPRSPPEAAKEER